MRILVILSFLSLTACTAVERADVYNDLIAQVPKVAEDAATGGPVGAIVGAVTTIVAVAGAYFTRKYIQKKYSQPKV